MYFKCAFLQFRKLTMKDTNISLPQNVHPASFPLDTGDPFPAYKAVGM